MFFAKAVFNQQFKISGQLALVLTLIFGLHSAAYGKQKIKRFTPSYKVEGCDCVGFSADIPTFLSDLPGADGMDIYGEGKTLKAAEKQAQNMCIQTYRNFASLSKSEHPDSVTQNSCTKLKSTPSGEWVSI